MKEFEEVELFVATFEGCDRHFATDEDALLACVCEGADDNIISPVTAWKLADGTLVIPTPVTISSAPNEVAVERATKTFLDSLPFPQRALLRRKGI